VDWDENCATDGYNDNGNGAQILCPELCGPPTCPAGQIVFVEPPDGVVDARQPYPPDDPNTRQGIDTITLLGPVLPEAPPECWTLCETATGGLTANQISGVSTDGAGNYTLTLARTITPGAVTTITYTDDGGTHTTGFFTSHPANVNADSQSSPMDILRLIDYINGAATSPWGIYSEDVDQSGLLGSPDILRLIDLLNGAAEYDPWLNLPIPTPVNCP
jgi:hypothetical protein